MANRAVGRGRHGRDLPEAGSRFLDGRGVAKPWISVHILIQEVLSQGPTFRGGHRSVERSWKQSGLLEELS